MNNKAHLRPKDYDKYGDIIPSGWKEEKGDLISREDLKKALHNFFDGKVIDEPAYILRDVFYHIDNAPTVAVDEEIERQREKLYQESKKLFDTARMLGVERPQGEWIYLSTDGKYKCPKCDNTCKCDTFPVFRYCPWCGARMGGE